MKKYLVIGNPIDHSLSPKLQNYWMKINSITGFYEKKKINENRLKDIVELIKKKKKKRENINVSFV